LDVLNRDDPPRLLVPSFGAHFRHSCESRQGRSTSFELKEQYELNPDIWVCYCSVVEAHGPSFPHDDCQGGRPLCQAGILAWIWKEGKCACGLTARSRQGFIAVAAERPPLRRAA
jgi:hypothetical protein